jgi:hypothetical protein
MVGYLSGDGIIITFLLWQLAKVSALLNGLTNPSWRALIDPLLVGTQVWLGSVFGGRRKNLHSLLRFDI